MILIIGLDDTDTLDSPGTGRLARQIASELSADYSLEGVTRHQLLVDPRVPYTSHNSSAAILLQAGENVDFNEIFGRVRAMMLADYLPGSDPGLCVAACDSAGNLPESITQFGFRAQQEIVTQSEACQLAARHNILLEGLGGTKDGVIGALAAAGLAACREDGRYIWIGKIRERTGLQPVASLFELGISEVKTEDGTPVEEGLVLVDRLRPARRGGKPVAFLSWQEDHWLPVKMN